MPRKVFVAGEILTAADVNTNLMDQSVMVFDDATARTAALPSPIEGMVTYLKDSDQLFKYTTDWVPAGGLVAMKHALFTGIQSASLTAGANVAVTNLSITHTLANASNKLIISAYFGSAGNSTGSGQTGLGVADNGTLIGVGTSVGSRAAVGSGGSTDAGVGTNVLALPAVTFVYEPGDTSAHTYTVRAINIRGETRTVYINRGEDDSDNLARARSASALVIQEVAV